MTAFAGVIFDMDGTLTLPVLDFGAIRREIGIDGGDLVSEIEKLSPERRTAAWSVIERHEEQAITDMRLQTGTLEMLCACRQRSIKLGIVTRNTQPAVDALCELCGITFDTVVTREFPFLKPHPEPVLHIARAWSLPPRSLLVVGDYLYDIQSGNRAGTRTCFFRNPGTTDFSAEADYAVDSMNELTNLISPGSSTPVNIR